MSNAFKKMLLVFVCSIVISEILARGDIPRVGDMQIPILSVRIPDGYTRFLDSDLAFKFYNNLRSWNSARKHCIQHDSTLVIIDSMEKYEYVWNMTKTRRGAGPHVGIHKLFDNTEWVSVTTGLPQAEIPWSPTGMIENSAAQCLAIWNDGSGLGADACNRARPYVCEIQLP